MSKLKSLSSAPQSSARRHRRNKPTVGPSLASQITQFLASGGSATLIHWIAMALLVWQGAPVLLAMVVSAVIGFVFNCLFQFYWTFSGNGVHRKAIPAFANAAILGWCVNAGIFYFLVSIIHAGHGLAQLCATAALAVMNFILYKRIVFHERITREPAP